MILIKSLILLISIFTFNCAYVNAQELKDGIYKGNSSIRLIKRNRTSKKFSTVLQVGNNAIIGCTYFSHEISKNGKLLKVLKCDPNLLLKKPNSNTQTQNTTIKTSDSSLQIKQKDTYVTESGKTSNSISTITAYLFNKVAEQKTNLAGLYINEDSNSILSILEDGKTFLILDYNCFYGDLNNDGTLNISSPKENKNKLFNFTNSIKIYSFQDSLIVNTGDCSENANITFSDLCNTDTVFKKIDSLPENFNVGIFLGPIPR